MACSLAAAAAVPCACSSFRRWRCKVCVWSSDVGKWRPWIPERIGEPSEDHVLKKAHITVHGHQHIRRCGSTKITTGRLLPTCSGSPRPAAARASSRMPTRRLTAASAPPSRREGGEPGEREREQPLQLCLATTPRRRLCAHSQLTLPPPLSLWSSFSPFGSVAAKVGSSEERTSSVVGRFRRDTCRQGRRREEEGSHSGWWIGRWR